MLLVNSREAMYAYVLINRSALKNNVSVLRNIVGPDVKIMSVIKANAYGHGLVETARILQEAGSDWFGVIDLAEATQLRKEGITRPILVMGATPEEDFDLAQQQSVSLTIPGQINFEKVTGLPKIHLKIDTGMTRLGIFPNDTLDYIGRLLDRGFSIEGIFSHFANASDAVYSSNQLKKFQDLVQKINAAALKPIFHIANSAATLTRNDTHLDLVRTGIATYGLSPFSHMPSFGVGALQPVLSFHTKIVHVKNISQGTYVGYGCTFKAEKDMKIAVIGVGYAEGFDRGLSNIGEVLIHGKRCRVLGRVCMNQTIVDISNLSKCNVGDEVTLIGKQGDEEITSDEVASKIGTINYEVVTRIPTHIPRLYID